MRKRWAFALVAAGATLLAGCTGEAESVEPTPEPVITTEAPPEPEESPTAQSVLSVTIPREVGATNEIASMLSDAGVTCGDGWMSTFNDGENGQMLCSEPRMMLFYDPWAPEHQDLMESTRSLMESLYGSEGVIHEGDNWLIGFDRETANRVHVITGP